MKIAICNDIHEFGGNRLADANWSIRFPGTGWITHLYKCVSELGWEIASGDVALSHVQCGYWSAKEVLVIQEMDSALGQQLLDSGAHPLLLTCMESPLYACLFFDKLNTLRSQFLERMIPINSAINTSPYQGPDWRLRFPCFWENQIVPLVPWADKKEIVLVAANKYWSHQVLAIPSISHPRQFALWLKNYFALRKSSIRKQAEKLQLHDFRLEAVEFFSKLGQLSIYGAGWDNFSILPSVWKAKLDGVKLRANGRADDKNKIQSAFKFALCFENIAYPGYVTEKIIECFVAGVIPVYLGAPDIDDFVPKGSFINLRNFTSMEILSLYLNDLMEEDALKMIEIGRNFLKSNIGQMHSHEGFANWVIQLAKVHENGI